MLDPDLGPLYLPAGDVVCNLLQNQPSVFILQENIVWKITNSSNTLVTLLKHPYTKKFKVSDPDPFHFRFPDSALLKKQAKNHRKNIILHSVLWCNFLKCTITTWPCFSGHVVSML